MIVADNIRHIIYSLFFLNVVRPTPSIKQSGKNGQTKRDTKINAVRLKYSPKTKFKLNFRVKNIGAIKSEILSRYLAPIQSWVGRFAPCPMKIFIPLYAKV